MRAPSNGAAFEPRFGFTFHSTSEELSPALPDAPETRQRHGLLLCLGIYRKVARNIKYQASGFRLFFDKLVTETFT